MSIKNGLIVLDREILMGEKIGETRKFQHHFTLFVDI